MLHRKNAAETTFALESALLADPSSGNFTKVAHENVSFSLFGVEVHAPHDLSDALDKVLTLTRAGGVESRHIAFVNADCLNRAYTDWDYQQVLGRCDAIWPDGKGVAMASKRLGFGTPANINGTDLFPLICAESARRESGLTLYFLGGKPGVAERCADKMVERFPGIRIVGTADGYFEARSEDEVLAEIRQLKPALLLVGMGAPAQEKWIAEHRAQLGVGAAMGVGGLFDFFSGDVPRAPLFLRKRGFEWVWRLAMQPRRLFRRYVIGNPLFLMRVEREAWSRRTRRDAGALRRRIAQSERGRRQLDAVVSAIGLVAISPILLAAAIAIKLDSHGPKILVQERVGKNGAPFKLWKLRTMSTDAEERREELSKQNEMEGGVLFKMQNDPRVTRVGGFLRKYSIDELPQLWNILRGEMALVGPRPPLASEVRQYGSAAYERLRVRPGLTGLWQISGRSSLPFAEQVKLDIENVARRSEGFDTTVMVKTVPAVLKGSGAW